MAGLGAQCHNGIGYPKIAPSRSCRPENNRRGIRISVLKPKVRLFPLISPPLFNQTFRTYSANTKHFYWCCFSSYPNKTHILLSRTLVAHFRSSIERLAQSDHLFENSTPSSSPGRTLKTYRTANQAYIHLIKQLHPGGAVAQVRSSQSFRTPTDTR